ncbi:MAG TPA: hypothetical protein VMR34_04580 [Candidatus Saccharimonadales bacterium]|nr:hypothetical protein [Candidatus Saccharimonadales bacterium]
MEPQSTNPSLNQPTAGASGLPDEQITVLKNKTIHDFQELAKTGVKTRRVPKPGDPGEKSSYDWYDKLATYEGDNWSISYSNFDSGLWELQMTRVTGLPNGHSQTTSFSINPDNYGHFPGFQVYKEGIDQSYRPAKLEELVYLSRVSEGIRNQVSSVG